ncbi:MAG TPA: hypothetical protein VFV83_03710, partial [Chthoniobacteraceae bacterium]|nr:hypothetical protein [Chthoniobacteraceae bacterium]
MKFFAVLVSGFLAFAPVYGQERSGELLAQNRPAAQGRSGGAADANAPGSNDDTMVIPSNTARPIDEPFNGRINTVNLWKLVQSGGWAMIPLAFLSILTVMLVLVYLFTLRRSSILTPHYMNTADVLLKKRDYLGLLAISSRHSEAVARVVQRTLDFATKNPNASF